VPLRCPQCGSVVEPLNGPHGLVCPACRNTGRVAVAQPPAWPVGPAPAAKAPGILVAAMAFGVAAIVLFPLGLLLGAVAVILAVNGRKRLALLPPGSPGDGLATGGLVLGIVGMVVGVVGFVVLSSVLFVLVSNLGPGAPDTGVSIAFNKVEEGPGGTVTVVATDPGLVWEDFTVSGTAECRLPQGPVEPGDFIACPAAGDVRVAHAPSNTLVYVATFVD
jgi:hypothetical protein